MSEGIKNEAAKKRRRFSPKILKGINITLMSIILIVFIYLQVPWKVNAIFIANLLGTIFLKKSQEKWGWLILVVVIASIVIWVFLPDDNTGWRPYTFDKEIAEMESKRFVPYNENAAVIYNQLLENYDSNSTARNLFSTEIRNAILKEFWKNSDYPEATEWIEKNQNIIQQMMRASEKQSCWFPMDGSLDEPKINSPGDFKSIIDLWWGSNNRLYMIRDYYELIIASANNNAAEGREDFALQQYIALVQISKHLYQQPIILDFLVGIAINLKGLEQINKIVTSRDINDTHLSVLEQSVQGIQYNWPVDLNRLIDYEKLMFKSIICSMFYQMNSEGKIRLNRDPNSTFLIATHFHESVSGAPTVEFSSSRLRNNYWREKKTKAMVILCWFFVPSTPEKTAVIIDDIYKNFYAMGKPDFDWKMKPMIFSLRTVKVNFRFFLEIMSQIIEANWAGIHDRYILADAHKRASLIIIDLRRYKNKNGHWPDSLEEIETERPSEIFIDPINNGRFVYKLTDNSFKLYSKGKNNIDEDGKSCCPDEQIKDQTTSIPTQKEVPVCDDILIWPPE